VIVGKPVGSGEEEARGRGRGVEYGVAGILYLG